MTSLSKLSGCRVLIVEDEVLIGLVLEDVLDMLDCCVVGNAARLEDAYRLVDETTFDVAIVDVNIGSNPVFPLADVIRARGIPVIFATGGLADAIPERFHECAVLEKPYVSSGVEAVLEHTLSMPNAISTHH